MTKLCRASGVILWLACLSAVPQAAQQGESAGGGRGLRAGGPIVAERQNMPAPQGFSVVLVLGEMQGTGAAENVPSAARKALADMKDFLPYKSYRLLDTQWTLCCGRSAMSTRLRGPEEQDYDLELYPNPTEISGKWNVRFALRDPSAAVADAPSEPRLSALTAQRKQLENQLQTLRERYNENHPQTQQIRARIAELEAAETQARNESTRRGLQVAESAHRGAIIDTSFTMDIGETVVVGTSRLKGDKALIALLTAVASTRPAGR